ncbi:unnamed protein product [Cochlearia groenlandica]
MAKTTKLFAITMVMIITMFLLSSDHLAAARTAPTPSPVPSLLVAASQPCISLPEPNQEEKKSPTIATQESFPPSINN